MPLVLSISYLEGPKWPNTKHKKFLLKNYNLGNSQLEF